MRGRNTGCMTIMGLSLTRLEYVPQLLLLLFLFLLLLLFLFLFLFLLLLLLLLFLTWDGRWNMHFKMWKTYKANRTGYGTFSDPTWQWPLRRHFARHFVGRLAPDQSKTSKSAETNNSSAMDQNWIRAWIDLGVSEDIEISWDRQWWTHDGIKGYKLIWIMDDVHCPDMTYIGTIHDWS